MAILDNYSKKEFNDLASQSKSVPDFLQKLGYVSDSTNTRKVVLKKISEYQTDISHFTQKQNEIRTEENVFCENSTASQSVLRRWYKKGEYSDYKCSICNMEPIWQGKELTLILDHINGKNHDNRLENLRWVCPNCNQQLDTTGYKSSFKGSKKTYCISCGKEITNGSTYCIECFAKSHTIPIEKMLITREELKQLIRTQSFMAIGKKYGVSDNAIRKWCDKHSLPRRKSDINKYTDEEWETV